MLIQTRVHAPKGRTRVWTGTRVDPDLSSVPLRLVLHLSDLSVSKWVFKLINLQCLLCKSQEEPHRQAHHHVVCFDHMTRMLCSDWLKRVITLPGNNTSVITLPVSGLH